MNGTRGGSPTSSTSCPTSSTARASWQAASWLDAERENILAALRFLGDSGEAASALRLALELSWYWVILDNESDAYRWLTFALDVPGESDPGDRALAAATSLIAGAMSESPSALGIEDVPARLAEASQALEGLAGRRALPPPAMLIRCWVALFSGVSGRAEEVIDKGLADENPWVRAAVRMFRANVAENAGDLDRMRSDSAIALRQFETIGDRWGQASALSVRSQVQTLDGDLTGAIGSLTRAAELMGDLKARNDEAQTVMRIAGLHMRLGAFDEARRHIESSSLAHLRGFGPLLHEAMVAALALAERDPVAMRRSRERLMVRSEAGPTPAQLQGHAIALVLAVLALLQVEERDLDGCDGLAALGLPDRRSAPRTCPSWPTTRVAAARVAERARPTRGQCGTARRGCAAARSRGPDRHHDFPAAPRSSSSSSVPARSRRHTRPVTTSPSRTRSPGWTPPTWARSSRAAAAVRLGGGRPAAPAARTPPAGPPSRRASTSGWSPPGHRS